MNIVISLAQFEELRALQKPVIVNLANEVKARFSFVPTLKDQTIESVLQTPRPIRKDGIFGAFGPKGIFVEDKSIAGIVPNGPRACTVVFNDGKPQEDISNANPLSIKYKAQIGAQKNNRGKRFDWDIVICETVAEDVGYKFRSTTVEGHVFSFVVAKDAKNKINPIKYDKC